MEEKDYLLFENYLSGDLSSEEKQQFEKLLTEDASVNRAFETYKDIASHLEQSISNEEQSNLFKENLQTISEDYFNVEQTETKTKRIKPWNLAIAASVVLLLGFFIFNQFSTPTYSDYNDFEVISLTERGGQDELLKVAELAFNNKNYDKAAAAFNTLLENDSSNNELKLYSAISNIEIGNYKVSDILLEEITQGKSIYVEQAKWIYALSQLKQKRYGECIEVLKTISEESENYDKAQKLIKKLD